jgi:hypothetical protein
LLNLFLLWSPRPLSLAVLSLIFILMQNPCDPPMSVVEFLRNLVLFLMKRWVFTKREIILYFRLWIVLWVKILAMFLLLRKVLESSITLIVQATIHLPWKTPDAS